MHIPEPIQNIIQRLEQNGHKAYVVGGCVRDSLMGRAPKDWDICSSALPEEVMAIFGEDAFPTGLKHGTVTVNSLGTKAEVTTFRVDGTYSDHRRPDHVEFSHHIEDDLSRRDFTMNAIALGLDGRLIDPFNGQADIQGKLIRCVGEPCIRFEEDALRMFRGLRFSAVLGFSLDSKTMEALCKKAHLSRKIAPERIRVELEKLLLADDLSPLVPLFGSGLMDAFCSRILTLDFSQIAALPKDIRLRWAGLCTLLENLDAAKTEAFLSKLRCDHTTIRCCSLGIGEALACEPKSSTEWKHILSRIGPDAARCAAASVQVLGHYDAFTVLEEVLTSGECWSLSELAVNGKDLTALGYDGKALGSKLQALLAHVIRFPEDNTKDILLSLTQGGVQQ